MDQFSQKAAVFHCHENKRRKSNTHKSHKKFSQKSQ